MGGQIVWPDASYDQRQILANVPKLTSLLSILGSCYIIFDICRLERRNTYHRIIFGMNVMDLLALIAWFFTTWPMPQDTEGVAGAKGNQGTCDAQGFFSQLSIATVLYNACLAIYFMLVIKWGWTEHRIKQAKLEYYVHAVCIGVGIGTAIVAQIFELYNPAGWQCWIASAPIGCTESWEMEDNDDIDTRSRFLRYLQGENNSTSSTDINNSTTANPPADDAIFPCTRGDNANLFLWFFFYLPLWACIIVATVALYQVYSALQQQDQKANKWRQGLMVAAAAPSKIIRKTTKATSRVASKATHKTVKVTSKSVRYLVPLDKERSRLAKKPTFTPAQKRKLRSQSQERELKLHSHSQESRGSPDNSEQRSASRDNLDVSYKNKMEASVQANAMSTSGRRKPLAKGLPPLLGSHQYSGRIHHPNVQEVLDSEWSKKTSKISKSFKDKKPKRQKKQHSTKSKLVTSQALLYLLSFYIAWFFPSLTRIQKSVTSEGIAYYHWVFLSAIFVPLQGMMNFIVYIRPKILQIRREKKRLATLKRRSEELAKRTTFQHPSTHGTFGGRGSSSALMTTTSISNEDRHEEDDDEEDDGHDAHNEPFHREEKDASFYATEGPGAPSLELSEVTLHQFNGCESADLEKAATQNDDIRNRLDEEGSLNQDDALEDLFDAFNNSGDVKNSGHMNSSGRMKSDRRPKVQRSHSSTSNMLHMRQVEDELEAKLMKQFNNSVCYDSDGHVLLTNSVDDDQSSQPRLSGWRALQKSALGGFRRSASSMSSSTNSRPDIAPPLPDSKPCHGSRAMMKSGDCILDSDNVADNSEPFQQAPQDFSFASIQSLLLHTPIKEEHGDRDIVDTRPSDKHASMEGLSMSQPCIAGREKRALRRTSTDPDEHDQVKVRSSLRGSRRRGRKSGVSFVEVSIGGEDPSPRGSTNSALHKLSKRQLMHAAKDNWVSKRGAKMVKGGLRGGLKGGKKGMKSIRNFAVDFKDALKNEYMDDWATALDDSDDKNSKNEGSNELNEGESGDENGTALPRYNGEEEKEEISVIQEEDTETNHADVGLEKQGEKQGSLPSLN